MIDGLPQVEDGLVTKIANYQDYIDAEYPEIKSGSDAEQSERAEMRTKLRMKFAQPGGPGAKFKATYEKMIKALILPKGAKDELGIQGDNGMPAEDVQNDQKDDEHDQSEDEAAYQEQQR